MAGKGKPGPNKGTPKTPNSGGSRKGCPNKATADARQAIAAFVDGNADRLQGWLDEIHDVKGPEAAFKCFAEVLEYHVPKLARTEVTGKDGGEIEQKVTINIIPGKPNA